MPVSIKPPPPSREKSSLVKRKKSASRPKSGKLKSKEPNYCEKKYANNQRLSIEVRGFDERVDVVVKENCENGNLKVVGNGQNLDEDAKMHVAEEVNRLKMMCADYVTQMRMMAESHERDLNNYKLKVQAEYVKASEKFRQDSAIIANERQKIFELRHGFEISKIFKKITLNFLSLLKPLIFITY